MKLILTGATGFIGRAVLHHALSHPLITHVVVLTRRPLQTQHPKLLTIIHTDFTTYPTPLLTNELRDAEAVIWALGTPLSEGQQHLDFLLAAAEAFATHLLPGLRQQGKGFRFVNVSGMFAEKEEGRSLWFLQEVRKLRGKGEKGLVEFEAKLQREEAEGERGWRTMNARPGVVLRGEPGWAGWLMPGFYIPVEELAGALVDLAVCEGGGGCAAGMFVENEELRRRGKRAIEEGKSG
ncbi:hypothetical protein KC316_g4469 [Hortaea werneckii]|nr:hypothetical protein KC324_g7619 [Hortaea werneckii]KAI7588420.1 hypothetical protein KC316_g4469 [Hortaea werneckii]